MTLKTTVNPMPAEPAHPNDIKPTPACLHAIRARRRASTPNQKPPPLTWLLRQLSRLLLRGVLFLAVALMLSRLLRLVLLGH